MAINIDDKNYRKYLNAAETVLKNHFRSNIYSFDGITDCAVCLVQDEKGWNVYLKERNAISNLVTHMDIVDAIIDMINRISGREAEIIKSEFYNLL